MYHHFAIMRLDDMLDNRQSQAGATDGTTAGGIDAVEAFEKPGQVLFRNTLAAVLNLMSCSSSCHPSTVTTLSAALYLMALSTML